MDELSQFHQTKKKITINKESNVIKAYKLTVTFRKKTNKNEALLSFMYFCEALYFC